MSEMATSTRITIAGGLINMEERISPPDITPLWELAELGARRWEFSENNNLISGRLHGNTYLQYHQPLQTYDMLYKYISDEKPSDAIRRILREKGEAVCFVAGTDDNPFQEIQDEVNIAGKNHLIVIAACLKDRRDEAQKLADTKKGYYVVEGTIGSPRLYANMHMLLDSIGQQYIDTSITKILGGWGSIPFYSNLSNIVDRITSEKFLRAGFVTEEEQERARQVLSYLQSMSPYDRQELFNSYRAWIVQAFELLHNPSGHVVFGEIPTDLENVVNNHIRTNQMPVRVANASSQLTVDVSRQFVDEVMGVFKFEHYAEN